MDDEKDVNQGSQEKGATEDLQETAKAAADAAIAATKAAGKAAAGDEVGAAIEVVKAAPSFFTLLKKSVAIQLAVIVAALTIPALLVSMLVTPLQTFSTMTAYMDQYGTIEGDDDEAAQKRVEFLCRGTTTSGYDKDKSIDEQESEVVKEKLHAGIDNHYLKPEDKGDYTQDLYSDTEWGDSALGNNRNSLVDENGLVVNEDREAAEDAASLRHIATKYRVEARAKETRRVIQKCLQKRKGKLYEHIKKYISGEVDAFNEPTYGSTTEDYQLTSFNISPLPNSIIAELVAGYTVQQNGYDEGDDIYEQLGSAPTEDSSEMTLSAQTVKSILKKRLQAFLTAFQEKLADLLSVKNVFDNNFVNYMRWIGYQSKSVDDVLNADVYEPWSGTFLPQPIFEERTKKVQRLTFCENEKKKLATDKYDSEINKLKSDIKSLEKYETGLVNYVVRASKPTCFVYLTYHLRNGQETTLEEVKDKLDADYNAALAEWERRANARTDDNPWQGEDATPPDPGPRPDRSDPQYSDPGTYIKKTIKHVQVSCGVDYISNEQLEHILGLWSGGDEDSLSFSDEDYLVGVKNYATDDELITNTESMLSDAESGELPERVKEKLLNANDNGEQDSTNSGADANDADGTGGGTPEIGEDDDIDEDEEDSDNELSFENRNQPFDIDGFFDESNDSFGATNTFATGLGGAQTGTVTPTPTQAETDSNVTTVVFGSDYQHMKAKNGKPESIPKKNLNAILGSMYAKGVKVDGAVICGDYSTGSKGTYGPANQESAISGIVSTFQAYDNTIGANRIAFVQGNHDSMKSISERGLHDYGNYLVYVLNCKSEYPDDQDEDANKNAVYNGAKRLNDTLNDLLKRNESRPIFIAGHVPLHITKRTTYGDNTYAGVMFDVINQYGEYLNLVYLCGHNHNRGFDNYMGGSCYFREPGESLLVPSPSNGAKSTSSYKVKKLNFVYMNAGYLGYYSAENNSDNTLTCGVCRIYQDKLTFFRYSKDGPHCLSANGSKDAYADDSGMIPRKYYGRIKSGAVSVALKNVKDGAEHATEITAPATLTAGSPSGSGEHFYYHEAFGFTDDVVEQLKESLRWGRDTTGKLVTHWKIGKGTEVPESDSAYKNPDVTFIRDDPYQMSYHYDVMRRQMQLAGVLEDELMGNGDNIVAIANAEWAKVWKDEHQTSHADHYDKSVATGKKYQDSAGIGDGEWCCAFVYWCAEQCGYVGGCFGSKTALCQTSWNYFQSRGLTHVPSGYMPQPGDLIYFHYKEGSGNAVNHIGIVESCDGTTVYTIEGNTQHGNSNNSPSVYKCHHDLTSSNIYGYASPEYPADSGGALSSYDRPQDYFYAYGLSQGYSPAAVAALMGNAYQECGNPVGNLAKNFSQKDYNQVVNKKDEWDILCESESVEKKGVFSFGVIQWQEGRRTNLEKYCKANGLDEKTIEGQTAYCFHELETTYHSVREKLKNTKTKNDIPGTCYFVRYHYEGCKEWEAAQGVRDGAAVGYFDYYQKHPVGTGGFSGAGGNGTSCPGNANATKYLQSLNKLADWLMSVGSVYGSGSIPVREKMKHDTDCATYAFCGLYEAGLVPKGTKAYGNKSGISYKGRTKSELQRIGTIVTFGGHGKDFRKFVAEHKLQPGDIVFLNKPHTQAFAYYDSKGNDYWWSVDHATMKKRNLLRKGGYGGSRVWGYFRLNP